MGLPLMEGEIGFPEINLGARKLTRTPELTIKNVVGIATVMSAHTGLYPVLLYDYTSCLYSII